MLGGCNDTLIPARLGFGFVGFESEEAVEQVCQTHFHQINGKTVCTTHSVPHIYLIILVVVGSLLYVDCPLILYSCFLVTG